MKFGYACINTTLAQKEIVVNRSMMRKTFLQRGLPYASELALKNVVDFEKVIEWNIRYRVLFYRMSSDMFPWMSEYEIAELPDFREIESILKRVGARAKEHDLRLTFHPGPFNVLASQHTKVITNTIKELRQHGEIMDLIGLPRSPHAKINIHIGASYGDRALAMRRFCDHFRLLTENVSSRITIENDDKANLFSVSDLTFVHREIGVPIVFDYLHHKFCTGGLSEEEAFHLALSTWPADVTPVVHFSSARKLYEDTLAMEAAHADYIYERIPTYGKKVDVMFEAKAKELALREYNRKFKSIREKV